MQAIGYTVLLLGILIFVHELGHFLVAKAFKVKVLRFSIGFGPKLFGITRGETEYVVAALPLGGYVKMAGDSPYDELPPAEAHRGFLAQTPWKRALIVAAGPAFNLLFPILVFFAMFVGAHKEISTRAADLSPGGPAARAGLQPGDRIVAIDGVPVRSFRDIQTRLQDRYDRETVILFKRGEETKSVSLVPEPFVERGLVKDTTKGIIGVMPTPRPAILGVPAGSVAEKAGLKTFDRVLAVNGERIKGEGGLREKLRMVTGEVELEVLRTKPLAIPGVVAEEHVVVTAKVPKQEGEGYAALGAEPWLTYVAEVVPGSPAADAGVKVGDKLVAIDGKPVDSSLMFQVALAQKKGEAFELTWQRGGETFTRKVAQRETTVRNEVSSEVQIFQLGILLLEAGGDAADVEFVTVHYGIGEALMRSLAIVPEKIKETATILGRLVIGQVPMKELGGPIMVGKLAARTTELGIDYFLQLLALISVNLGLVNLAPIPILDGFQLLSAMWEGVRRRPIPMRAREVANMVGLVILVSLMVRVFYNDLTR